MLDDLIQLYYKELSNNVKEHAKLGDFLKMVELRYKLAPGGSDQKQFWKMLEQIRQEALQKDAAKKPSRQKKLAKKEPKREVK